MPLSNLSDEEIIISLKGNTNPNLLGELMQRHRDEVIQKCYHHVKDRETAKDLSQEVFLRVMLKIHDFNMSASFSTWLYRIIHNRCIDHIRKDKMEMHLELFQRTINTVTEELPIDEENKVPTVEKLKDAIEELDGEDKYLFLLKYQDDLSINEIHKATHIPVNTIKSRLHRIKKKL